MFSSRFAPILAFLLTIGLAPGSLSAATHVRSSQNGTIVKYIPGSNVVFRANPSNASGLRAQEIFSIFSTSIERWIRASQGGLAFTYFQGTDPARYPTALAAPQDNSIFFTSQASVNERLPCSVIGLTEVWYDLNSGNIRRSDMRLNDTCFRFSNNVADTRMGSTTVYLGDVLTHELGHSFGLDHSQNLQSTMFFTAAKQMHKPSCDDQSAMVSNYALGVAGNAGNVSGRVTANGSAVFGAYVSAIQIERGTVIASGLTERDGRFELTGLEPGTYTLLVEPYYPGPATLNAHYSQISSSVCGGNFFQRSFLLDENGMLESINLGPGARADVGAISVSCLPPESPHFQLENSIATAPELDLSNNAVATMSVFGTSSDHYYRIDNASGTLSANALAYSLFSRTDVSLEWLDSAGRSISGQSISNNVFSAPSGYTNFDAKTVVTLGSPQTVFLHVYTRGTIASHQFPASNLGVSNTPYYVVTIARDPAAPSVYPAGPRCEYNDSFGIYSQPGEPNPYVSNFSAVEKETAAGCGSITNHSDNNRSGGMFRLVNFAVLLVALGILRRILSANERSH